jgi:hypothetical protein
MASGISERQEEERRQVMLEREKMKVDREVQAMVGDNRKSPVIEQLDLIEEGMAHLGETINELEKAFDPVIRKDYEGVKDGGVSGEKDLDARGEVLQRLERINSRLNERIMTIRDITYRAEV